MVSLQKFLRPVKTSQLSYYTHYLTVFGGRGGGHINWRDRHLVSLAKKIDLQECAKYRGIMLLSFQMEILSGIILRD